MNYNTIEGITGYLSKGLVGLNLLSRDRQEAGYKRRESLTDFVVRGTWALDTCGNTSKIVEAWSNSYRNRFASLRELAASMGVALPDVISRDDLFLLFPSGEESKISYSSAMERCVPVPGVVCDMCGKTWTLETAHDMIVTDESRWVSLAEHVGKPLIEVRAIFSERTDASWELGREYFLRHDRWIDMTTSKWGGPKNKRGLAGSASDVAQIDRDTYVVTEGDEGYLHLFRQTHTACDRVRVDREALDLVIVVFNEAGFAKIQIQPVPNRYWPPHANDRAPPWHEVTTELGKITFGRRKNVFDIDWGELGEVPEQLFADEETTKSGTHIHAWTTEKAIGYLRRLRANFMKVET